MYQIYLEQALWIALVLSGIPLAATCLAGLVVAVVQAASQIQDQSIGYLVKLACASASLACCGGWFCDQLIQFSQQTLISLALIKAIP